jgi:hypothetical protein
MGRKTWVTELTDLESRRALSEVVLAVLSRWNLKPNDAATLLGLPPSVGLQPGTLLPDSAAVLERAGHLLAIDRALYRLYPYRPDTRDHWVSMTEPALDAKPPLELMLRQGLPGIQTVREFLEARADARPVA